MGSGFKWTFRKHSVEGFDDNWKRFDDVAIVSFDLEFFDEDDVDVDEIVLVCSW